MPLDIVLVSTYESHCGIATYCRDLADALQTSGHRVTILAEGAHGQGFQDRRAIACWQRGHAYASASGLGRVVDCIRTAARKPNIVHFQHEFAFWSDADFESAVDGLQEAGIAVTVTLHTVHAPPRRSGLLRRLPHLIEKPIVHTHEAAAALLDFGHGTPVVIEHGVTLEVQRPNVPLREKYGLNPSMIYGLCPGFISTSKNHQEILQGLAASAGPSLIIAGECRDENYRLRLESWLDEFGVRDRVQVHYGWQTNDDFWHIADFVILGAGKTSPYSASGQLAQAAGRGLPVIAKSVPIYRDGPALFYDTAEECGMLIEYMGTREHRARLSQRAKYLALTRTWDNVASRHVEVYTEIIKST